MIILILNIIMCGMSFFDNLDSIMTFISDSLYYYGIWSPDVIEMNYTVEAPSYVKYYPNDEDIHILWEVMDLPVGSQKWIIELRELEHEIWMKKFNKNV